MNIKPGDVLIKLKGSQTIDFDDLFKLVVGIVDVGNGSKWAVCKDGTTVRSQGEGSQLIGVGALDNYKLAEKEDFEMYLTQYKMHMVTKKIPFCRRRINELYDMVKSFLPTDPDFII